MKRLQTIVCTTFLSCALGCVPTDENLDQPTVEPNIEYLDGKADTLNLTEGSPEAETILSFVNQPLDSDTAALELVEIIDSTLSAATSARIVAFRRGDDERVGTADDELFDSLAELDAVPWVTSSALRRLLTLARLQGFGGTGVACDEFVTRNRLDTLDELLDIQESGCDHFTSYVNIKISDPLPADQRNLEAFHNIRRIEGEFRVTEAFGLRRAQLPALEYVGKFNTGFQAARLPFEFPVLREAGELALVTEGPAIAFDVLEQVGELHSYGATEFPKLREAQFVAVSAVHVAGFNALERVGYLAIETLSIHGFERLAAADAIYIEYPEWDGELVVDGFHTLESVGIFELNSEARAQMSAFTRLRTADSVVLNARGADLIALKVVTGDVELHAAPSDIYDAGPLTGLNTLESIGGSLRFHMADSVSGLQSLRSVGGPEIGFDAEMLPGERDDFLDRIDFTGNVIEL